MKRIKTLALAATISGSHAVSISPSRRGRAQPPPLRLLAARSPGRVVTTVKYMAVELAVEILSSVLVA